MELLSILGETGLFSYMTAVLPPLRLGKAMRRILQEPVELSHVKTMI